MKSFGNYSGAGGGGGDGDGGNGEDDDEDDGGAALVPLCHSDAIRDKFATSRYWLWVEVEGSPRCPFDQHEASQTGLSLPPKDGATRSSTFTLPSETNPLTAIVQ